MKTLLLLALAFSFVACNKEASTETAAPAVETAAPAAAPEAAPAEAAPAAQGEAN